MQLDVWQTYMHQFNVRRSYCERSHMAIAAENGWDYYGQKYLTVPEGLDLGSEYQIVDVNRKVIASTPAPARSIQPTSISSSLRRWISLSLTGMRRTDVHRFEGELRRGCAERNLDLCDEGGLVPRVHERHVAGAVGVPGHRVDHGDPEGCHQLR